MNHPPQWTVALDLGVELKASVFYNIGLEYQKLGRPADAITNWQKALVEDEKHSNARRHLVIAYVSGDTKAARKEAPEYAR